MSHIVSIQTEVRDAVAVQSACRRLSLPEPVHRMVQLFNAQATGLAVELPGWRYPVVCELDCGRLRFDNFNERWGRRQELVRCATPDAEPPEQPPRRHAARQPDDRVLRRR